MLKNYTSTVPAHRSINLIEAKLVRYGAINIMKEYDTEKRMSALFFILPIQGKEIPFKIPARIKNCEIILNARVRRPTIATKKRIREQAERTAWKLLSDWVDLNISLIEIEQVEIMEVFMPYLYNATTKKTYFEQLKETNYKGLLGTG